MDHEADNPLSQRADFAVVVLRYWRNPRLLPSYLRAFGRLRNRGFAGCASIPVPWHPTGRKWYLPQNLYYEYQWRGWEYRATTHATTTSATSTSCLKVPATTTSSASTSIAAGSSTTGTETSPLRQGSALLKGTRLGGGSTASSFRRPATASSTPPDGGPTPSARRSPP